MTAPLKPLPVINSPRPTKRAQVPAGPETGGCVGIESTPTVEAVAAGSGAFTVRSETTARRASLIWVSEPTVGPGRRCSRWR
jgi:hypothetical protein